MRPRRLTLSSSRCPLLIRFLHHPPQTGPRLSCVRRRVHPMRYELCLSQVSDDDLLRRLTALLGDSRRVESDLVAHIGEVEDRRLYARAASPSMFAYCTEVLHLSGAEAYLRIAAARAAREHPAILDMLGDGRLHLSGIAKLVPHLTRENAASLLARATHRSKRQIEELVAEIAPRPDAPTVVRKLPVKPTSPLAPEGWPGPDSRACGALQLRRTELAQPLLQLWPRRSSPWPPRATRFSSPRAPSCVTSSSGFRRSCRFLAETLLLSSSRP
jgi:hypothetical protein